MHYVVNHVHVPDDPHIVKDGAGDLQAARL